MTKQMIVITKQRITDLLKKLVENGFTHTSAAHRAIKFINDMDDNKKLPQIAWDEDDVVLLVWEEAHNTLVISLEPELWHLYNSNGERLDDQKYIDGGVEPIVQENLSEKETRR